MMDREWRDKWVAALRSGKYKQGYGRLKLDFDKYCCLGVLQELATVGTWKGSGSYLSKEIISKVDQTEELSGLQFRLSQMNDRDKLTFPQIADWIEENL